MVKINKNEELKCFKCKEVFYESKEILEKAGVADGQMYYNTRCPNCNSVDTMNNDFVGVPDSALEKYNNQNISYQEMMNMKTGKQKRKDKEKAKRYS